jgi:hypothetical protein
MSLIRMPKVASSGGRLPSFASGGGRAALYRSDYAPPCTIVKPVMRAK